jgi:putative transposase
VRQWCFKFGQTYANALRRRRPRCGDKWHLDEMYLKINGKTHDLWRAVDQDGNVLDIQVQSRRNKHAAKRFFRKLLKGLQYIPRVIITDTLKSYGAATREILPAVEHRQHKGLNNRAEHSHQPLLLREKKRRRFTSAKQAQRFLLSPLAPSLDSFNRDDTVGGLGNTVPFYGADFWYGTRSPQSSSSHNSQSSPLFHCLQSLFSFYTSVRHCIQTS